jgi:hypothetical protein
VSGTARRRAIDVRRMRQGRGSKQGSRAPSLLARIGNATAAMQREIERVAARARETGTPERSPRRLRRPLVPRTMLR